MSEMHECQLQFATNTPGCMGLTHMRISHEGQDQWACEACLGVLTGGFCIAHGHAHVRLPNGIVGCAECARDDDDSSQQMMG